MHKPISTDRQPLSRISIDQQVLAAYQQSIVTIETVNILETNLNPEKKWNATIEILDEIVPLYFLDADLCPIKQQPLNHRICITFRSDQGNYAVAIETITPINDTQAQIQPLEGFMLAADSVITHFVQTESTIAGIINNELLATVLDVQAFYQTSEPQPDESTTHFIEQVIQHV